MAYVEGVGEVPEEVIAQPKGQAPAAPAKPSFMDWLGSPEAMAFASGLLKASGPSPVRISMGQALGMGGEEMLKAKLQFGNQQLDKDKFAYQRDQDAKQLALQRDKFGLDKEQFNLQKDLQNAHKTLYQAQVAEAMQKLEKQKQINQFIQQLSPGGNPFDTSSTQIQPPAGDGVNPQMATTPQQAGIGTNQDIAPTPGKGQSPLQLQNPPVPGSKQAGMLNAMAPTTQQAQSPGMLNQPKSPTGVNDVLMKLAILNNDFRSAGQIYKNQNDWEVKEGTDQQGNPIVYQQNKMTREIQPVQGIQPLGANPALKYQQSRLEEEAKNDADMRKRINDFSYIKDNFSNIRNMLAKGVQTGAGFDQITSLQNFANTLGLNIDKDKLNDAQFLKNQIESAFNKYQTATRIPGIGSQSDREFEALRKQFVTTDLTPETIKKVMDAFENNLNVKQSYIDHKEQWASTFGSPMAKDPRGRTFNQVWRLYEKNKYSYGDKK